MPEVMSWNGAAINKNNLNRNARHYEPDGSGMVQCWGQDLGGVNSPALAPRRKAVHSWVLKVSFVSAGAA